MSEESVIDTVTNDLNTLLNETDEIKDLVVIWKENNKGVKKFKEIDERIKAKIKVYLKERKWSNYQDDKSKISVTISNQKRQSIDKEQLKMMLTDAQYAMVLKTTTFEKLSIITPQMREKMKKFVK